MTGNKLYQMMIKPAPQASKLIFRDSWMILQTTLDDLKKTFGLITDPKGQFPHYYNKNSNLEIIRKTLPPIQDYNIGSMKPDKHKKFLEWYTQNKNSEFILYKELKIYCEVIISFIYKF
jgi:hypothetical protein